jgi:hypothetical protein
MTVQTIHILYGIIGGSGIAMGVVAIFQITFGPTFRRQRENARNSQEKPDPGTRT